MKKLSEREIEVLGLAAQGYSNKEIAKKLWLSYFTVRSHFEKIYRKLDIHSDRQAIAYYYKNIIQAKGA